MAANFHVDINCDPLGPARVISGVVYEEISAPNHAQLTVQTAAAVEIDSLLGAEAEVSIGVEADVVRTWHLIVTGVSNDGQQRGGNTFTLELRHELALLGLRSDVRMFQEMSAKDIVSAVFSGAGLAEARVDWQVQRALTKRTYCVQHRESDFDFVSRLLEYEGIWYFVTEDASSSKLTCADSSTAFTAIEGSPQVPLSQASSDAGVIELEMEYVSTADSIVQSDWSYEHPNTTLLAKGPLVGAPVAELFEFPSGAMSAPGARAINDLRREEIAAQRQVGRGRSDDMRFRAGSYFELTGTNRDSLATKYLLRRVSHIFSATQGRSNLPRYTNAFVCSPLANAFRPARKTPSPLVGGSESVVAKGPSGEEIFTDELGRMKGRFFWDRVGTDDAKASVWMRVLQHPIGLSLSLARINWEMTVRFTYGDPDRPVAMSRVDNGGHAAPYSYPAAASAMSFKTHTSPGGGKYNEFTMEDGGGGMKFGATASKDWKEVVNNNKTETIAVDEKVDVGVNFKTNIGANQTVTIGANQTKTVSSDGNVAVKADRKKTVGAAETITISGANEEKIIGSDTESVGATHMTVAGLGVSRTSKGSHSLTVGAAMVSAAGVGCAFSVAGSLSESIGAVKVVLSGGAIAENVTGACAVTVGGVQINVAGGNRTGASSSSSNLTVGGVVLANAGEELEIKSKSVHITVMGMANLIGGGGILNMSPGSIAFVGLVTLTASGSIKLSGAPNLVG